MTTIDQGTATGSANEVPDEEYRELWAYVRHVENLRHTMVGGLVASAAAVLALLPGDLGKAREFQTWTNVGVLSVLAVLFLLALVFLVAHKRNYEVYLWHIRQRSAAARDAGLREKWLIKKVPIAPFQAYYAIVTSLVAGVGLLLAYAMGWAWWGRVCLPGGLVLLSMVIYWHFLLRGEGLEDYFDRQRLGRPDTVEPGASPSSAS